MRLNKFGINSDVKNHKGSMRMIKKELVVELQDDVKALLTKVEEVLASDVEQVEGETPVDHTPATQPTQEQLDAYAAEKVAAYKAELKQKYAEQQVAETDSETGFAALLD